MSPPALTVKNAVKKCLSAINMIKPAFKIGETIISNLREIKIEISIIGKNSF
jgi:hypothetical protein